MLNAMSPGTGMLKRFAAVVISAWISLPDCVSTPFSVKRSTSSVVTDEVDRFTEKGVLTQSGKEIQAEITTAANRFNIPVPGDIAFSIDGKPVDLHDTVTYRGMMFTGLPNLLWIFGYFRA